MASHHKEKFGIGHKQMNQQYCMLMPREKTEISVSAKSYPGVMVLNKLKKIKCMLYALPFQVHKEKLGKLGAG